MRILQSVMLDRFKTVGFLTPLLQAGQGTGRDRDQTWRDKEADRDRHAETGAERDDETQRDRETERESISVCYIFGFPSEPAGGPRLKTPHLNHLSGLSLHPYSSLTIVWFISDSVIYLGWVRAEV